MDITNLHSIEFPNGGGVDNVKLIYPKGLEYNPVNYIETTGTQYIDLGIVPNSTLDMFARFEITGGPERMVLLGSRTAGSTSSNDCFTFFICLADASFRYDWFGNTNTLDVSWAKNRMYNLAIKRRSCTLYYGSQSGGQKISSTEKLNEGVNNLYLFALNTDEGVKYYAKCKLYAFTLVMNTTDTITLIPVLDKYGKACLMDAVNKKFYYSATTDFIYG